MQKIPLRSGTTFHVPWYGEGCDEWLIVNSEMAVKVYSVAAEDTSVREPDDFVGDFSGLHLADECVDRDEMDEQSEWVWTD